MRFVHVIWGRLVQGSSWQRLMRITSSSPELIMKAIQAEGREVKLLRSHKDYSGKELHILQLFIYRLEELTLTDIIREIDPEAKVDVMQLSVTRTPRSEWKRHSQKDVPDVSKYGNEFSD
ncbi:hypothetical protein [Paenibacillus qinlingensis]|uniref:Uncharacterized membrane-anchored protein YitT (DUF2179 family) n=1 Tax=Paenibacillus qinlingensis TaxID=1837343 RepID=A0ABU1NPX0_9BACL|nr:hypothetical protein [Paenibacillus qinlingensis]MDR6549062.1 uncharacterized membrane-anchored protein YitT (DUF2179 family) [Paenibacillus qinlingensis]